MESVSTPPPRGKPYGNLPHTIEGQIVRIADNLSYVSQEIEEGLKLDESIKQVFQGYAGEAVLQIDNGSGSKQMTREEFLKSVPGFPADPQFMQKMFDPRLGPRLMAMIRRIEGYNKHMAKAANKKLRKTRMTKEKNMPILQYDPVLQFVLDFIWIEFIAKIINRQERVLERVEHNRTRIRTALERRMNHAPTDDWESAEFAERKNEVDYYYRTLTDEQKKKRVVAHHIALMTTPQVDELVS